MRKMRTIFAAAVAAAVFSAGDARGSYTYSVAPVTVSTNFGAGSNLTTTAFNNGAVSSVFSGTGTINIAQVTETSTTVPPATDTGNIGVSPLLVTINNQNGGGSGAFSITGNFIVTRSDTGGDLSTFSLASISPPTLTLGSFSYILSTPSYSAPTINAGAAGDGGLSFLLSETAVPEPTAFAVIGLAGAALLRRKRSR